MSSSGSALSWDGLVCKSPGLMVHPGLPAMWLWLVLAAMAFLALRALWFPHQSAGRRRTLNLVALPTIRPLIRAALAGPWVLVSLKLLVVLLFIVVIIAGLYGTPIPERNLATTLTWNIWWTGVIVSVFFLGSAWCGVCPWDSLASWLVRRRLWRRAYPNNSLNLRVPRQLRNVWPALLMFVGLTWLELGVGVTTSPYGTALLALLMVVLATVSMSLFERKAFCRYFCPVGRTVGFYSQLAPVELRPVDPTLCARCTTLDCYHGTEAVEPCPTNLVMGRLTQNTYCTSCGNCSQSCGKRNVSWRLRSYSIEAIQDARPRWDDAWFLLILLALTAFHGVTMVPFWELWMSALGRFIGDSGQLLWSFSIGLGASLILPVGLYALAVGASHRLIGGLVPFRQLFSGLAFVALPLAFAYHLAHNLNHLVRESKGLGAVFTNPLGIGTQPVSLVEKHAKHVDLIVSQDLLFALQAGLMVFGFWIALKVILHRGRSLGPSGARFTHWHFMPVLLFACLMTAFHVWLLMQPMVMRV